MWFRDSVKKVNTAWGKGTVNRVCRDFMLSSPWHLVRPLLVYYSQCEVSPLPEKWAGEEKWRGHRERGGCKFSSRGGGSEEEKQQWCCLLEEEPWTWGLRVSHLRAERFVEPFLKYSLSPLRWGGTRSCGCAALKSFAYPLRSTHLPQFGSLL